MKAQKKNLVRKIQITSFSPAGRSASIVLPARVFLFLILSILMLLPAVTADAEQYLTGGVDRQSTYQQDGNGFWDGRTPLTYTRSGTIQSYFPLVADIDNDDANEIIIIDTNTLSILNFTPGTGLIAEQSITHGATSISSSAYFPTPSLIDTDSDGTPEIISWNASHMLMYSWNGTATILNQSAAMTGYNLSTPPIITNLNPVIKCGPANSWASGNVTCIIFLNNRSGATTSMTTSVYDVNANVVRTETGTGVPNGNADTQFHNTHLFDGDSDGFLEAYHSEIDAANGDMRVYSIEVSSGGVPTRSLLLLDNRANGRPYTDILISRVDGVTPSVTWGFSDDGTNYDIFNARADNGNTITASYCTALTCPEGDQIGSNMFVDDGTYGTFSGDVCYYLRNYANNDPGINIDTILCASEFAGVSLAETEITNTANFTNLPLVHLADMTGTKGLLTPRFITSAGAKNNPPVFTGTHACIPVDTSISGSLDVICLNSTVMTYFDDGYTNQQVVITAQTVGTGNPVCQGVVQRFTPSITDAENDITTCFVEKRWSNTTKIENSTNQSTTPPNTVEMQLTQNTVGTFQMVTHCSDQFHTTFATRSYIMTVSNDTNICRQQDQNPQTTQFTSDNATATDEEFTTGIDNTLTNMGVSSRKARAVVWLFIMAAVVVGSVILLVKSGASGTMSFFTTLLLTTIMLVMGWYFDMISTVVLVIVGLMTALIFVIMVTTRLVSEG